MSPPRYSWMRRECRDVMMIMVMIVIIYDNDDYNNDRF